MNKVIRGKRYDTETAELLLAGWHSNRGSYKAYLYRKRTGEYFLFLEDIAIHTNYDANDKLISTKGGKDSIMPITTEDAKKWAEEYAKDADEYEAIFGAVDDEKTDLHLVLTNQEVQKLKEYAVERKITAAEVVSRMIRDL